MNQRFDFTGKVAVVTGAGGAVGGAVAGAMAQAGATVVAVDITDSGLTELVSREMSSPGSIVPAIADVTDATQTRAFAKVGADLGGIDFFFNNAGVEGRVARIADIDLGDFRHVQDVNVIGVLAGMQAVLPFMRAGGSIVNTASTAALVGSPGLGSYVASKHAVLGLTRTVALEVQGTGVRVNAICPGPIAGRMMASLDEQRRSALSIDRASAASYVTAEEVAQVVLFFFSDAAKIVSGQTLVVGADL